MIINHTYRMMKSVSKFVQIQLISYFLTSQKREQDIDNIMYQSDKKKL